MAGRPQKEYDRKSFVDLVGLGCTQEEICWYYRDENGKPANKDTLSRWCQRTFGVNFQEFYKSNGGMYAKITLRRYQLDLAKKSAAMAIFLGKNMLNQTDKTETVDTTAQETLAEILKELKDNAINTEAE